MPQLILASTSPFRRALLERLGLPFSVVSPEVDETALDGETPEQLVRRLAIAKATRVAGELSSGLVIGSDQVAVHGDTIVGKPRDHAHAVTQLREASGNTIRLHTGLALINVESGVIQDDVVPYSVEFRQLTDAAIENYLRIEQPYGCAGSLKAEGLGIALLKRFIGDDPTALIGLPLIRLCRMLRAENVDPVGT